MQQRVSVLLSEENLALLVHSVSPLPQNVFHSQPNGASEQSSRCPPPRPPLGAAAAAAAAAAAGAPAGDPSRQGCTNEVTAAGRTTPPPPRPEPHTKEKANLELRTGGSPLTLTSLACLFCSLGPRLAGQLRHSSCQGGVWLAVGFDLC